MKKLQLCLLLLLSAITLSAAEVDRAWLAEHYSKSEYRIPMRDGVQLYTAVYTPRDRSKEYPILITRTPYSCRPYGGELPSASWCRKMSGLLLDGYILVEQDVRGRWQSEGEFVQVRPYVADKSGGATDESSDAYDTVEWLLANIEGNNGRVGFRGTSYPGFYAYMAGLDAHPAVCVVSPQAPVCDWFMGDDVHHNGALMLSDAFRFIGGNTGRVVPVPTTEMPPVPTFYTCDDYSFFIRHTVADLSRMLDGAAPFWDLMAAHPDYDEWWQERDARTGAAHISVPVLVAGGWFDAEDCYGALNIYKALRREGADCRIVMGPWSHGGWNSSSGLTLGDIRFGVESPSEYFRERIELPLLNYYLKGAPMPDVSRVTLFSSGDNRWHRFDEWPEGDAVSLYLAEQGLTDSCPAAGHSSSSYVSDPAAPVPYSDRIARNRSAAYMVGDQRFASCRPDVLSFVGEPLDEPLTLMGDVEAELFVSISTTDADFVVKIIDVFPDDFEYDPVVDGVAPKSDAVMGGYQMLVRGEVMRGRYRRSFSKPEAFAPRRIERVAFGIPAVGHTFRRGHRVMIQIQSSWFPLVDRNPQQMIDIYSAEEQDFIPARITVHHDRRHPSRIIFQKQ